MERFDPNAVLASVWQEACDSADALIDALARYQSAQSGLRHTMGYIAHGSWRREPGAIPLTFTEDGKLAAIPTDALDALSHRQAAVREALQRALDGKPVRQDPADDEEDEADEPD